MYNIIIFFKYIHCLDYYIHVIVIGVFDCSFLFCSSWFRFQGWPLHNMFWLWVLRHVSSIKLCQHATCLCHIFNISKEICRDIRLLNGSLYFCIACMYDEQIDPAQWMQFSNLIDKQCSHLYYIQINKYC